MKHILTFVRQIFRNLSLSQVVKGERKITLILLRLDGTTNDQLSGSLLCRRTPNITFFLRGSRCLLALLPFLFLHKWIFGVVLELGKSLLPLCGLLSGIAIIDHIAILRRPLLLNIVNTSESPLGLGILDGSNGSRFR